ncbi:MAG: NADH-quinone oxidoreductase subunit A [bacterium]
MSNTVVFSLIYVLAFLVGGLIIGVASMVLSWLLAPKRTRSVFQKTLRSIECGVAPIGHAWIRYGVVYYLYALIFVAFSVDVLFLFPVALVYNEQPGWLDFAEVLLFVGILALVIVYAWKKGIFSWKSKLKSHQA